MRITRAISRGLALAAAVSLGGLGTVHVQAFAATTQAPAPAAYTYTQITDQQDPTFNQALGINHSSVIAGYDGSGVDAGHPNKGFTVSPPYGPSNFASENFPGSVQTQVIGINDAGYTAGFWVDSNGNNRGFVEWNGVFTSVENPKTSGTTRVNQLLGLNNAGIAVGFYNDATGASHAYKYDQNTAKFTDIVIPGATSSQATGINNHGDVVGFTVQNGVTSAFLLQGTVVTEFQYPGSVSTQAFGINDMKHIVGTWGDFAGQTHGFGVSSVKKNAHFVPITLPNGATDTFINGINDYDQIVGFVMSSPTSSIAYVGKHA